MNPSRFRHIFLPGPTQTDQFTNPRRGGKKAPPPRRDRAQHSDYLKERLGQAWKTADDRRAVAHATRDGVYIDFFGEPGYELPISSLEARRSKIRLLSVRKQGDSGPAQTIATVYIPNDRRTYFLQKIQKYAEEEDRRSGKPKNAALVNSISDIRLSVLESFWQDGQDDLPGDTPQWVEVWLSSAKDEAIARFQAELQAQQVPCKAGIIKFPERAVLMVEASRPQLASLVELSDDIAELRLAKEVATRFINIENAEQVELVRNLLERIQFSGGFSVRVCIMDGGVNNGHLLLAPVLEDGARHTVESSWGTNDSREDGHGTLMAGIAVYGDLVDILGSGAPVRIEHALESVKILPPPPGQNPVELWGDYTARGVYGAEIQSPDCKRIVCLAVTATDTRDRGRPSSWSGMVDEVASGYSDDRRRLFIVSAGNAAAEQWRNYPVDNRTNEIHDPAQAWNCLTVGAYTNKAELQGPEWSGWAPLAPAGGLSPYSTTSVTWPSNKWPIKPEVVFEGGNVAKGPNDSVLNADDLQLLSTWRDPQAAQFATHNATSAASALAARMAAQIQVDYPGAWPETVRALIVHAAEWTDTMKQQFLPPSGAATKRDYARLLRICGYGVPSADRARYCTTNSLTLIGQAELQPYTKRGGRQVTRDMHLYQLPWPAEVLQELGEVPVEMRVTLSYFVEPSPGQVGWDSRYRYASHALRFEVNGAGENKAEFVARINRQARDEQEGAPGTSGPSDRWTIGIARNVGSIHSDIWRGSAIDLAASNLVGIYPATGWWKERHHLGRLERPCRYSLIVSIHAPGQEIDIYTPVSVQVGVPIEVPISGR